MLPDNHSANESPRPKGQGLPDGDEPDPGRSLMVAALVGIAVLALLTIVALGYVAWRATTDQ